MSLLNVGSRALLSNQIALQTAGHNIANVSVPGYSRQRAELTTENGQYTSAGYIGKGVNVQTIQRSYDAFLTKQATLASTLQAGDSTRSDYLKKLGDLFPTGSNGLGASINTMLNAFSDVASAPTDLTARTVALTQIDETASRMRTASQGIDELQSGIQQSLRDMVRQVNSLAQGIADVNRQITRTQGSGQPPNDLLDRRDQLIRELNGYVQTSSIPADDGSVGVFIAGSQALVLGTDVATLGIGQDDFGDRLAPASPWTKTTSAAEKCLACCASKTPTSPKAATSWAA
jgi:flagellar hook-associated protein 1 FlgK